MFSSANFTLDMKFLGYWADNEIERLQFWLHFIRLWYTLPWYHLLAKFYARKLKCFRVLFLQQWSLGLWVHIEVILALGKFLWIFFWLICNVFNILFLCNFTFLPIIPFEQTCFISLYECIARVVAVIWCECYVPHTKMLRVILTARQITEIFSKFNKFFCACTLNLYKSSCISGYLGSQRNLSSCPSSLHTSHSLKEAWLSILLPSLRCSRKEESWSRRCVNSPHWNVSPLRQPAFTTSNNLGNSEYRS